ncbi:microfibril-associated glycoprotein 4-like isoform X2 [Diabrotica virgifera virgifera]|uniref:Fibrinogen C-terminal domain-containing protein n=1 Tax=Diabrotica virgifera virgifera TaxID=50390 RepID=A0ABM5KSH3_DIAVI|nr:microfibril-associated glycoprotein 4-like isoform X2 [Diabrotica virgifera virgifera]
MNSLAILVLFLCGNLKIALSETQELLELTPESRPAIRRRWYPQPEEITITYRPNALDGCRNLVGTSKPSLCSVDSSTPYYYPRSCSDILQSGGNRSGIYVIKPRGSKEPFEVLCDMEIQGGGWTTVQRRFNGREDFYQPWRAYKFGFGTLNGEFWLGLHNIYQMTGSEQYELLIELTDKEGITGYARYASFAIAGEKDGYNLTKLGAYSGNVGDALSGQLNAKFSTLDVDLDGQAGDCAKTFEGGWWYKDNICYVCCLNGKVPTVIFTDQQKWNGINWDGFRGKEYNLSGSRMLIRPVSSI